MSDARPADIQPQREASSYTMNQLPEPQPVRIVDIDMPIGSMTTFMVKWAIATIPAILLLGLLALMLAFLLLAVGITL